MGHVISLFEETSGPDSSQSPDIRQLLVTAYDRSTLPSGELRSLGIPPRDPILGDWFMEGDLGFIYAPRGLGKTWLALALASAISNGHSCGPWAARAPRRVLYVDGEMPCESVAQRIAGLGGGEQLTVLNHEALFHLTGRVLNLADPAAQDALTEHLRREGISVLVLDNLSCLFSGVAENDADSWGQVLGWLLTLRRHRIAVVVVHHSGRNRETMRGTSRREDAAFWVLRLDHSNDSEESAGARFISRFTKNRNQPGELREIDWQFLTDPQGLVHIRAQCTSNMEAFRTWIENGLTGAEDIAQEMGISKGTVSKMARQAMDEGWLRKSGREYEIVG